MSASVEPGVEGSRAGCAHPRDERRTVGAEAGGQSGVGDGERAVPHAWRGEHGASHARGFGTDRRSQDDARALRYGRCAEAVGAALCPDADHADRADRRGDAVAGVFAGRDGGAVGSVRPRWRSRRCTRGRVATACRRALGWGGGRGRRGLGLGQMTGWLMVRWRWRCAGRRPSGWPRGPRRRRRRRGGRRSRRRWG